MSLLKRVLKESPDIRKKSDGDWELNFDIETPSLHPEAFGKEDPDPSFTSYLSNLAQRAAKAKQLREIRKNKLRRSDISNKKSVAKEKSKLSNSAKSISDKGLRHSADELSDEAAVNRELQRRLDAVRSELKSLEKLKGSAFDKK